MGKSFPFIQGMPPRCPRILDTYSYAKVEAVPEPL